MSAAVLFLLLPFRLPSSSTVKSYVSLTHTYTDTKAYTQKHTQHRHNHNMQCKEMWPNMAITLPASLYFSLCLTLSLSLFLYIYISLSLLLLALKLKLHSFAVKTFWHLATSKCKIDNLTLPPDPCPLPLAPCHCPLLDL